MYVSFYKLDAQPFRLSPDPKFFYASTSHSRALAYLQYGLTQGEGFVVITGAPGTGKTTLAHRLLSELNDPNLIVAHLTTTQIDAEDVLRLIAASFGLEHINKSKAALLQDIEDFLLNCANKGKRCILLVDEAQNLPIRSLEELRMLSNFQFQHMALLQSFLLGQDQFRHMLNRPELEQLRQRVIANYHLSPMNEQETQAYIENRLHSVGWKGDPLFTPEAFNAIYGYTEGVPRRINIFCERLLLFGYVDDLHEFTEQSVNQVIEELANEVPFARHNLRSNSTQKNINEKIPHTVVTPEKPITTNNANVTVLKPSPKYDPPHSLPGQVIGQIGKSEETNNVQKDAINSSHSTSKTSNPILTPVPANKGQNQTLAPGNGQEGNKVTDSSKVEIPSIKKGASASELLKLLFDFTKNSDAYPNLTDLSRSLPDGIDTILELASASEEELSAMIPGDMPDTSSGDLKSAARFFIKHVLFQKDANHYRVLGLSPDADLDAIQTHYRLLIRLFYKDSKNHPENWNVDYTLRINKAYNLLKNADERRKYDQIQKSESNDHQTMHLAVSKNVEEYHSTEPDNNVTTDKVITDIEDTLEKQFDVTQEIPSVEVIRWEKTLPKILILADTQPLRSNLTRALAQHFQCFCVSSGEEGWRQLLNNDDIQLVIADMEMPEKDGQKLIKRIRSYGNTQVAEMPILAVAGEEENDKLKQKALKEGASDFLTKNTDDVEILARVRVHHKLVQTTGDINTRYQLANQLLNVRERLSNTAPSAPKSSTHNNQRIVSKIGLITLGVVIVVTAILALYYKHDSTKKTERITAELKVRPKTNNSKIVSLDSVLTAKSSSKADNQSATNSRDAKPTFNLKSLSDENRKPTARSKKISDANTAFNRASKNETKSNPLPDYLFTIDKTGKEIVAGNDEDLDSMDSSENTSTLTPKEKTNLAAVASDNLSSEKSKVALNDDAVPADDTAAIGNSKNSSERIPSVNTAAKTSLSNDFMAQKGTSSIVTTSNPDSAQSIPSAVAMISPPANPLPIISTSPDKTSIAYKQKPESSQLQARIQTPSVPPITQRDLAIFVFKFVRAYEEGDINQFMNLFDGANKNQIKRDYEQFFANSESRQFILSDVSWDIKDHSAIGKGSFEIKIKSNGEPMSSDTGSVTFNVVKNGADDITIDKVVSTVNLNDAVQQTPTTANTQISTASSLVNTSSRLHEEPVSMSSSRPVLLAKASTQNQTTSKNSITQRDLAIFLFKFVRAYEEGNIEQFMALFNNNAHTEDRKSKEAIRKDYDYFFQKTEIRQLLLGEMKWDIKDHSATGKGSFEVKIKTAGAYRLFSENGFVTFSIVKNDNDLLVTSFVHSKTN